MKRTAVYGHGGRSRLATILVLLMLALCELPLQAASYYVSASSGNDSWPGTESQPWKTLMKASSITYQPGDSLLLKRGDTWSDQELILQGNANVPEQGWIALGAYGGDPLYGPRPRITHPSQDRTPGLIDWSALTAAAQNDPAQWGQYADRDYVRLAIRLTGSGWKIKDIEITDTEMGVANYLNPGDGIWIENCYLHDLHGLAWPKWPGYPEGGWTPCPSPIVFAALHIYGSNVTIKDCVIVENDGDGTFLGGDGIMGYIDNALFENLYIDGMYGGGIHVNGANITARNVTLLNGQREGCWYGPVAWLFCESTNYLIDSCEVAYTCSGPNTADEHGICVDSTNVYATVKNCFIHDNQGPAFEFNVGAPKQQKILIENNVTYKNGKATYPPFDQHPSPEFAGDCYWPLSYDAGEGEFTFANNRIYKTAFAGQHLFKYASHPPLYYDDYSFYEANAPFYFSGRGNVILTAYDNYVPPAPPISQTNIATTAQGVSVAVSSNSADAYKLIDDDFATSWIPDLGDPSPWISFAWDTPKQIDKIRLFDRREVYNCTRSGRIDFSDGSWINVTGGILDNGAMREVVFDAAKNVDYVSFWITRQEGQAGLSEFQIFTGSGPTPPAAQNPDPGQFTVSFEDRPAAATPLTGKYPNNRNGIDWSLADWTTIRSGEAGYAYLDFQPLRYQGTEVWHLGYAHRTFTVPAGKKLKGIEIAAPAGTTMYVSQNGAGSLTISNCDGALKTYTTGWTTQCGDIIQISVYMPANHGAHEVRFDNIVYGD